MSGLIVPEMMSDEDYYRWFTSAPTQHDVDLWTEPAVPDPLPAWRGRHPEATCGDKAGRALAEIEEMVGR